MGLTMTRASKWTAAGYGTGHLEITPPNELIINDIIAYVKTFSSKYPQEAAFVFKEPLEWRTNLEPSLFDSGYEVVDNIIKSKEKDEDGHSLLNLNSSIIKVRTFGQLAHLLELAKEKAIAEAQACLEANRDPIAKILGRAFSTVEKEDRASIRLLDTIKVDEGEEAQIKTRILILLHQLDVQLLNTSLMYFTRETHLTPNAVKNEVDVLWRFCGEGESTVLKNIEYTEGHMFQNGCRAPPWRQVHGEICYLAVTTHDTEPLFITCSRYGVFLNGGQVEAVHDINYERKSDIYSDLITLLKHMSPKFAENLTKQNIKFFQDPPTGETAEGLHSDESIEGYEQEKAMDRTAKRKLASNRKKSIRRMSERKPSRFIQDDLINLLNKDEN